MNTTIKKVARWALFLTLCFTGFSAFLICVAETAITYRMKITVKPCIQWAAFIALSIVGCIAFFLLAGDDDPANPLPLSRWLLIKVAAGCVLYLCYRVARWLHRLGYLPAFLDR